MATHKQQKQKDKKKEKKKWASEWVSDYWDVFSISTFWSLNKQRIFALLKPTAAEDNTTQCNCTKVSRCSHFARHLCSSLVVVELMLLSTYRKLFAVRMRTAKNMQNLIKINREFVFRPSSSLLRFLVFGTLKRLYLKCTPCTVYVLNFWCRWSAGTTVLYSTLMRWAKHYWISFEKSGLFNDASKSIVNSIRSGNQKHCQCCHTYRVNSSQHEGDGIEFRHRNRFVYF